MSQSPQGHRGCWPSACWTPQNSPQKARCRERDQQASFALAHAEHRGGSPLVPRLGLLQRWCLLPWLSLFPGLSSLETREVSKCSGPEMRVQAAAKKQQPSLIWAKKYLEFPDLCSAGCETRGRRPRSRLSRASPPVPGGPGGARQGGARAPGSTVTGKEHPGVKDKTKERGDVLKWDFCRRAAQGRGPACRRLLGWPAGARRSVARLTRLS